MYIVVKICLRLLTTLATWCLKLMTRDVNIYMMERSKEKTALQELKETS